MRSPFLLLAALAASATAQADPIRVVTSIPDHAALVRAIGAEAVEVESIVKGNRDVHAVELLPSFMVKVQRADVYVEVGMGLDSWSQQIVDGSRNARLVVVDASEGVERLGVPTFKVDASHGDVHLHGNPHYWLDPGNVRPQGEAILAGLARVRPDLAGRFRANLDAYVQRVESLLPTWTARLAPFAGARVVSFHDSWPYFARRFDIRVVDFLEPEPGVPPTPSHVADLQRRLAGGDARAILMESYFDDRVPEMLARASGVPVVKVPVLVGAAPGVDDPISLYDTITSSLAEALARQPARE